MAENAALPSLIERALASAMDAEAADRMRDGFKEASSRPVTLRANTVKADAEDIASALDAAELAFERVAWYGDAFVLGETVSERDVWSLPIYQEGAVYLQSLSSMLPPLVLAPQPGSDILDMCAAPGGKTSQLYALADGRAHITACELHAPRAEKLSYNLEKLGCRNVNVMRCDARRLDEFFSFDQILLDAPCTGTGTFRMGDERASARMTDVLLGKVTRSQRALLDRALTVLKPGGTLVYSTCSILPEENDAQVKAALKRHRDCKIVPLLPQGETSEHADARDRAPLAQSTQAIVEACAGGQIPTVATELAGTLTVPPTRLYEGFYLALIRRER